MATSRANRTPGQLPTQIQTPELDTDLVFSSDKFILNLCFLFHCFASFFFILSLLFAFTIRMSARSSVTGQVYNYNRSLYLCMTVCAYIYIFLL